MNANPPKVLEAIKQYDAVLKDDPNQPEALAYRGWLLHLARVDQQALDSITKAVQADPSFPDAHFFRGELLCTFSHDQAGAVGELRIDAMWFLTIGSERNSLAVWSPDRTCVHSAAFGRQPSNRCISRQVIDPNGA